MAQGDELVEELAAVWREMPRPSPGWHPYVELMRQVDDDVRAGLDVLGDDAEARAALDDVLDEPGPPESGGGDVLDAAAGRLATLPRPEGQHPYLLEIMPALEAAAAVLAALGRSPAARGRFAELRAARR